MRRILCLSLLFLASCTPEPEAAPVPDQGDRFQSAVAIEAQVGGAVAPDGKTELQADIPGDLQQRNIASRGLGCCVFRSIDHAARYQNVPALVHFPEWMVEHGVAGGGWPAKVDQLIPLIARDRGLPTPEYIQVEGPPEKVLPVLKLAGSTGRMVCVTYSRSPTGRYNGQQIAHMVNSAACGAGPSSLYAILDNNYIGEQNYEWLSEHEFIRACGPRSIWAVILLAPPPPRPPRN
jgi:hypothetical protein